MTVSIIENWTDISGEIVGLEPEGSVKGHVVAEVLVKSVGSVQGFPNLLESVAGQTLLVHVRQELANRVGLQAGQAISCRVRRGGPNNVFVHPDHLTVCD